MLVRRAPPRALLGPSVVILTALEASSAPDSSGTCRDTVAPASHQVQSMMGSRPRGELCISARTALSPSSELSGD